MNFNLYLWKEINFPSPKKSIMSSLDSRFCLRPNLCTVHATKNCRFWLTKNSKNHKKVCMGDVWLVLVSLFFKNANFIREGFDKNLDKSQSSADLPPPFCLILTLTKCDKNWAFYAWFFLFFQKKLPAHAQSLIFIMLGRCRNDICIWLATFL